jgi:hypothetical protein
MEWSCSPKPSRECREMGGVLRDYPDMEQPKIMNFDPKAAGIQPYPITTYQPIYFCDESIEDIKYKISQFCDSLQRPFHPVYDPITANVNPSRHIRRLTRETTANVQAEKQKEYFDRLKRSREDYDISSINLP